MTEKVFVAIDGDDVGNHLRDRIINDDLEGIASFSEQLSSYFMTLRSDLETRDYDIIFCAGDSLLAYTMQSVPNSFFTELPTGPCTISIGIGETPEYAYLALQLAKARGKKQVVRLNGTTADTIYVWTVATVQSSNTPSSRRYS